MGINRSSGNLVPAVERAIRLLFTLSETGVPLTLSELSDYTSTSRSTTYNILATLLAYGLVIKDERFKTYRLGLRLFELGRAYLDQVSLIPAFSECLLPLTRETGETVRLAIRDERDVVFLAAVEGHQYLRLVLEPGSRVLAYATAVGKILLAQLDSDELATLYADHDWPKLTPHTVASFQELANELQAVRRQGYASDHEESVPGIHCVAAPVRDQTNEVVAAISVGIPNERLNNGHFETLTQQICIYATRLSRTLGWIEELDTVSKRERR